MAGKRLEGTPERRVIGDTTSSTKKKEGDVKRRKLPIRRMRKEDCDVRENWGRNWVPHGGGALECWFEKRKGSRRKKPW